MSSTEDTPMDWVKSSYSSGDGGQCIEWSPAYAIAHQMVPVRDSKDPQGAPLVFSADSWGSFAAAVARGEFPSV